MIFNPRFMTKTLLFACIMCVSLTALSQKHYVTSDGEIILGFADINNNGVQDEGIPRFSIFFHAQSLVHSDIGEHVGIFSGLTLRNVGFIAEQDASTRKKFRTYNVGIPVGLKIGNMNNMYFFGGYELELPFNYKEKTFVNEEKVDKFNVWFSRRTPTVYHTLFAGVRFPRGISVKFKYYLTPFFNKNYTQQENGMAVLPYENYEVNTFHVSVASMITKGKKVVAGRQ